MSDVLRRMKLAFNPFEPTATGAPLRTPLAPPAQLEREVRELLNTLHGGLGVKTFVVVGEYGSGKTCLLQWLHQTVFREMGVKSFLFHDPGVHFYRLADTLLRTVGRKNFAKFIWELAHSHVTSPHQGNLFSRGFEAFNLSVGRHSYRKATETNIVANLQKAILQTAITSEDEVANCLARIVTQTVTKPYFQYKDFLPRSATTVVAESQEPSYFGALIRTIAHGEGADAVAFLIDEFEEIGLQKRLTQRAAHEYLATLRRLIGLVQDDKTDFWLVLSMTPDAYDKTFSLDEGLHDRLQNKITIESLDNKDARDLMLRRLIDARSDSATYDLFPFPRDLLTRTNSPFPPSIYSNPRQLVRICSVAIAQAAPDTIIPFTDSYLTDIAERLGNIQRRGKS